MTDRTGIFAGDDPFALAKAWLDDMAQTETTDPNAIALATVDADGLPNVRMVLLKEIEDAAFVFYTNYTSKKAQEAFGAGKAAFVLHSKTQARQIRVRGLVSKEDGAQADAYYASRSVASRIGAWASKQSTPLASRQHLMDRTETLREKMGGAVPRPNFWGGIRIVPTEIEFWADGAARLHDRFRWTRLDTTSAWDVTRLNP